MQSWGSARQRINENKGRGGGREGGEIKEEEKKAQKSKIDVLKTKG